MDPQPESAAPVFPAPATEAPAAKPPNNIAAGYLALAEKIRQSGLQKRRRWYYITLFTVLLALLAAAWTGFSLLGNSWYQLLIASAMGRCSPSSLSFPTRRRIIRCSSPSGSMNGRPGWSAPAS